MPRRWLARPDCLRSRCSRRSWRAAIDESHLEPLKTTLSEPISTGKQAPELVSGIVLMDIAEAPASPRQRASPREHRGRSPNPRCAESNSGRRRPCDTAARRGRRGARLDVRGSGANLRGVQAPAPRAPRRTARRMPRPRNRARECAGREPRFQRREPLVARGGRGGALTRRGGTDGLRVSSTALAGGALRPMEVPSSISLASC
jgi:hypothetical protein